MSIDREVNTNGTSPTVEGAPPLRQQSGGPSRLSVEATPWYPSRQQDSASSQPGREGDFPCAPPDSSGVSPIARNPPPSSEVVTPAQAGYWMSTSSRVRRTPSNCDSTSSTAASPMLAASTRTYATDSEDNVVYVPFHIDQTEEEIIRGLAECGGYWGAQDTYATATGTYEARKKYRKLLGALPVEENGPNNEPQSNVDGDDDDDDDEDAAGGDEVWEDDSDAYADEWDSLDEDEQAWIEEQMRPQDNPEGFF